MLFAGSEVKAEGPTAMLQKSHGAMSCALRGADVGSCEQAVRSVQQIDQLHG